MFGMGFIQVRDPLHIWPADLNNDTSYICRLVLMFPDKGFQHECEAKDAFLGCTVTQLKKNSKTIQ